MRKFEPQNIPVEPTFFRLAGGTIASQASESHAQRPLSIRWIGNGFAWWGGGSHEKKVQEAGENFLSIRIELRNSWHSPNFFTASITTTTTSSAALRRTKNPAVTY